MGLYWRIWSGVCAVAVVVLAIFVLLAVLQFDRIHTRLIGERLLVLADRAAEPLAAAARLGLPVSGVRNADGLLERVRQTDDRITAIHVFDRDGRIIHSTDRQPAGTVGPEILAARTSAEGAPWYIRTSEGFHGGVDVRGRQGSFAASVVVAYPAAANLTRVQAMAAELMLAAIAIFLITGALGAVLLRVGLRRQIIAFETIDRAIHGYERDAWRAAAGGDPAAAPAGEGTTIRHLLEEADQRYRTAGRALAAPPER